MNKNEKLLAARQKLKEFQLNKQCQEGFHTHQNENVDRKSQEFETNLNHYNRIVKNHEQLINNHKDSSDFCGIVNLEKLKSDKYADDGTKQNSLKLLDINKQSGISKNTVCTFNTLPSNDYFSHDKEYLLSLPQDNVHFFDNNTIYDTEIPRNLLSLSNQLDDSSKHVFDILLGNTDPTNSVTINCDSKPNDQVSSVVPTLKELQFRFNQSQNNITDLENLALTQNNELNQQFVEEINSLKNQIQTYLQTTNILITEKTSLNESVSRCRSLIEKKNQVIEKLGQEFKSSEYYCNELEKKFLQMQRIVYKIEESYKLLQFNHKNLNCQYEELENCNEEQKSEIAELQQSLNLKNIDLEKISCQVQENNKLLLLAELKLDQLTNRSQNTNLSEDQNQIHTIFEEQSFKLHEHLKTFNVEKSEIFDHYENYVKQLLNKYEGVSEDLRKSQSIIKNLEEREKSSDKLDQQEKQKIETLLSLESDKNQIEYFNEKINSLLQSQESLSNTLNDKEIELEMLKKEIRELSERKNQSVEILKLAAALESEQLGASRAISQNQLLKEQLSEMQNAFSTLSNTKLNLTQQLHNELQVNEELNSQLKLLLSRNEELQHELNKQVAIIKKMEIENFESKSKIYQENYQMQSHHLSDLNEKIQQTSDSKRVDVLANQEFNFDNETSIITADKDPHIQNSELIRANNKPFLTIEKITESIDKSEETHTHTLGQMIEPKKKLETRFKEMMEKVAELTDEKQRLEHLVLQLQGETETIGEYISLYHKQRSTLQRKAQDSEKTFRHLIEQYNQQHTQLNQLKVLLTDLLKINDTTSSSNQTHTESSDLHYKNAPDDIMDKLQVEQLHQLMFDEKSKTTEKIIDLMKNIIDCQDPCTVEQNFHPCLWCSGKLITV